MQAPWPYKRSIRVQGVNTRHSRTLESTQSTRDQQSKVQPCLANVHSAAENTPGLAHMRSTWELPTGIWTLSSHPQYNISIWNQAYPTTQTQASVRIPTVNPIRALLDQILTHFIKPLHMSLILKYSMTLRLPLPANRFLMKMPEKPPDTSTGLSTNTATSARTLGHHSTERKVSNYVPGSLREKYPNHE